MELVMDDSMQVARVYDWDQSDWDAQKDSIPWNYTIEFIPSIDPEVIDSLNTGRTMKYVPRIGYKTEWIGETMIVQPETVYFQQLLPLPEDPSSTPTDTTT